MRVGPLGIWELLIILVVVLLIFGPRRLPEMAKGLGQSVREFRKGIRDMRADFDGSEEDDAEPKKKAKAPAQAAPAETDNGSTSATTKTSAATNEAES